MLKQLLTNKKIVIVASALLLALIVGIVIAVTPNTKETWKDPDNKTEQSKEDANNEDDKEDDSTGLEILEPDQVAPEDSSNVSGSWEGASDSNTQQGNTDTTDKTDKTEDTKPSGEQKDEPNEPDEPDQPNEPNEPEKNQGTLEDTKDWSGFYG